MNLPQELQGTFLFADLKSEQLQELADAGSVVEADAGEVLFREGEPADFLWVLLEGELELSRIVSGRKMVLLKADRPGLYAGGFRAYGNKQHGGYRATTCAVQPSRVFKLPSPELARLLWAWFPVGKHLLDGLFQTVESIDSMVRERESLVALGTMAAGLAHELNNPAAAAVRAGSELGTTMGTMREGLRELVSSGLTPDELHHIFSLQGRAAAAAEDLSRLDPLEVSDREDVLAEWLEDQGINEAWHLAPVVVGAGLGLPWVQEMAGEVEAHVLPPAVRWLCCNLTVSSLLRQLEDATGRISGLVRAVKDYSYMDRAPLQDLDVHSGLDNTLVMLGHKLGPGVSLVKDYDRTLPEIEAYGSELNQVWLNLLDNAIDAVKGHGEVRISTTHDDDSVSVEIVDTGPGIEPDVQRRMFEPFFTTKEPGKGTGLGLDIARRIVVERHGGEISLQSVPGDTRFTVKLPLRVQAPDG